MQLNLFLSLCSYVGILMAPKKTYGPVTTPSFAGIELDSVLLEARLPSDKLDKCRSLISEFLHRKKVTLKEVLSLTGLSDFACSVVRPSHKSGSIRRSKTLNYGCYFYAILMVGHFS